MYKQEKEQYITLYKKMHRQSLVIKSIFIIGLLLYLFYQINRLLENQFDRSSFYLSLAGVIIIEILVFVYLQWIRMKVLNQISAILTQHCDLSAYLEILEAMLAYVKKDKTRGHLLCLYFNALTFQGDITTLATVFLANKKYLKKAEYAPYMKHLCLSMAAYSKDTTVYESLYAKHRFSRYHHVEGALKPRQRMLRNRDYNVEANYYLRKQDYERALSVFQAQQPSNPLEELSRHYGCARCLLSLQRKVEAQPHVDAVLQYPECFRYVRDIQTLLKGQEVELEQLQRIVLEEMLQVEKKTPTPRKTFLFFLVCFLLVFILSYFLLSSSAKPFISLDQTMQELMEVEVDDTLLAFTVMEEHVGIIKYHHAEEAGENFAEMLANHINLYSFADVVVNEHQMIEKASAETIGFSFEKNKLTTYPMKTKGFTYVLLEKDDITTITYQGIPQEIKQVQLTVWNQHVTLSACVIADVDFDEAYIKYS